MDIPGFVYDTFIIMFYFMIVDLNMLHAIAPDNYTVDCDRSGL